MDTTSDTTPLAEFRSRVLTSISPQVSGDDPITDHTLSALHEAISDELIGGKAGDDILGGHRLRSASLKLIVGTAADTADTVQDVLGVVAALVVAGIRIANKIAATDPLYMTGQPLRRASRIRRNLALTRVNEVIVGLLYDDEFLDLVHSLTFDGEPAVELIETMVEIHGTSEVA